MEWFSDTSVTASSEKYTCGSKLPFRRQKSTGGTEFKSRVPTIALISITCVASASVSGLILSSVVLAGAVDAQGQCFAQSHVLFASILSLVYSVLHICAARKGADLYPALYPQDDLKTAASPGKKTPFFQHPLHAWTVIQARIAFVGWASALTFASVAIARNYGAGGSLSARLALDVFFSAVALPAMLTALCIIERASDPFNLPWVTPKESRVLCRVSFLEAYLDRSIAQREPNTGNRRSREILAPSGPRPMVSKAKEEQVEAAPISMTEKETAGTPPQVSQILSANQLGTHTTSCPSGPRPVSSGTKEGSVELPAPSPPLHYSEPEKTTSLPHTSGSFPDSDLGQNPFRDPVPTLTPQNSHYKPYRPPQRPQRAAQRSEDDEGQRNSHTRGMWSEQPDPDPRKTGRGSASSPSGSAARWTTLAAAAGASRASKARSRPATPNTRPSHSRYAQTHVSEEGHGESAWTDFTVEDRRATCRSVSEESMRNGCRMPGGYVDW